MKIRSSPRPASLSVVCVQKIFSTPSGNVNRGFATAFLVRGPGGQPWLVTNWHVLTNRRPDEPGTLVGGAPQSPHALAIAFPATKAGQFLIPVEFPLYENGNPIWFEYKRELGLDIAAFPINFPSGAAGVTITDFSQQTGRCLEPGVDLIVVGFPFIHAQDFPYPMWKRAMVASEPAYLQFGNPQTFIDTPGTPGMSGSAVFRSTDAFATDEATAATFEKLQTGEGVELERLAKIDTNHLNDQTVGLDFVGIYAGSTSDPALERLQLGRMYPSSVIDLIKNGKGEKGSNPYPPELFVLPN